MRNTENISHLHDLARQLMELGKLLRTIPSRKLEMGKGLFSAAPRKPSPHQRSSLVSPDTSVDRLTEGQGGGELPRESNRDVKMTPEEIKALREYLGLSQGVFAQLLGVQQVTVNSWESGKHIPQISWDSRLKAFWERREAVRKQCVLKKGRIWSGDLKVW